MSKRGLGAFVGQVVSLRGYDAKEVSLDTATEGGGESAVQQQFADEVDINTIIRRFGITRQMPAGREGGVFGDFTGILDYHDAREAVRKAEAGFLALPPEVREEFGNDPGLYLDHIDSMSDEELAAPAPQEAPAGPRTAAGPSGVPAAPSSPPSSPEGSHSHPG